MASSEEDTASDSDIFFSFPSDKEKGEEDAQQDQGAVAEDVQRKSNEMVSKGDDQPDDRLSVKSAYDLDISMDDLTVTDVQGKKFPLHRSKETQLKHCFLGGGSFGDVFRVNHGIHGVVAVKRAKPGKGDHIKMYQKEIEKHVKSLTSEQIVSIKGFVQCEDVGCNCGFVGFVMKYMENGSLWDFRIKKWKDIPDLRPLTNRMVYQISSGMHFLHSKDIIHRDLKLQNVLIDGQLNVKIAGLGLATNLKTSGDNCWGTDSHKPPEAFRTDLPSSTKVVTKKYDVYSFAMTLYQLLTGIHPYSGRGFYMISLLKVEAKQTPSLQPIPENTTPELIEILISSWSYEADDRPNFTEITNMVKDLDTGPTYESLGVYLGQPSSKVTKPMLPDEYVQRGIENLTVNDHFWVKNHLIKTETSPAPTTEACSESSSQSRSAICSPKESPPVAQSQRSSAQRDPTIIFDSTSMSDQDYEIKLQVSLTIPMRASITSKMDQILTSLERCKHRPYWPTNNLLYLILSSHNITLHTIQLPSTVEDEEFTLFLRVSDLSSLEKLHLFSENGKLHTLLVKCFVDNDLKEKCLPAEPNLSVKSWQEQFSRGMEHFKKERKESTQKVNKDILLAVIDEIPGNAVKLLGRHLGLDDVQVENIVYEQRYERSSEQAYQVLRKWTQQRGQQATKAVLVHALLKAKCYDAARNVR